MTPSSKTQDPTRLLTTVSAVLALCICAVVPAQAESRGGSAHRHAHGPRIIEVPAFYGPRGEPIYLDEPVVDVIVVGPDDAEIDVPGLFDPPIDLYDDGPEVVPSLAPVGPRVLQIPRPRATRVAQSAPVTLPVPRPNLEGIDFAPAALPAPAATHHPEP